jgi:uncharacterized SAM-binding protein YcdF (DUF218 family)
VIVDILSSLFVNISLWLWLALAIILWRATRTDRQWRRIGIVALVFLWLLQTRPFAELIIAPLENAYATPSVESLEARHVTEIVVLSGGGFPGNDELLVSRFPHASLYRTSAALELCQRLGAACRLTFSGSSGATDTLPTAQVMEQFAHVLLPDRKIQSEFASNSTVEHPANLKQLLGTNSFVLVTSAYHMPRTMMVFTRAGLQPIPFPVDRYVMGNYKWNDLLPNAGNLETIQIALHEYIGWVWYALMP